MNHREVALFEQDIMLSSPSEIRKHLNIGRGDLTLLAGCPPCQGFSSLTTLNGHRTLSDDRNELIFQMFRFAQEFRPRAILMENVPGPRTR